MLECLLWALMPVLTVFITPHLAPLWALFFNTLFASVLFFLMLVYGKRLRELANKDGLRDILFASFWIMVLFILYFAGLTYTNPSNAAVIMFLQVLFAFFYFNLFGKEQIPLIHQIGALFMTIGAIFVLFPENFSLNRGDLMVLIAAMIAPVANRYQQKARRYVSAQTLLFVRSFLSLPFLAIVAYFFASPFIFNDFKEIFWIVVFSGFVVLGVSKILWIEGIYRISITKAGALAATGPLFTMFFAYLLLNNKPTVMQLVGIIPIILGGVLITRARDG